MTSRSAVARAVVLPIVVLAAACGGGSPAQPTSAASVAVSGLEKYPTPLVDGLQVQLIATIRSTAGTTEDCTAAATWTSSNEAFIRPTGRQPGEFQTLAPGDATVSAVCSGLTGRLSVHVEKATSWKVSGRVLAAPGGAPIADTMVTYGSSAPVRSDAAGNYEVTTEDASTRLLTLSAGGFQTRETYLRGGERRTVDIDLIGHEPAFPFALYRMMARNGHESPQSVGTAPTQPWTAAPSVYIWTTWKDTGAPVNNIEWYVAEITRVIPQLTGGRFSVDRIEYGPQERPVTRGWINLQFHHSGNWSYVGANPGQVQLGSDHTCNSYAVIHEFGHAMGYWHSDVVPSVMGGGPGSCTAINLWPDEQIVARTMYSRARGNVEPDHDPIGTVLLDGQSGPPTLVKCDRILRQ